MAHKYLYNFSDTTSRDLVYRDPSKYEEPWVSATGPDENIIVNYNKPYVFGGFEISPGPLYYDGTSFGIKDHWNYDSFGSVYGKVENSSYFTFSQCASEQVDGWRVPTAEEWTKIVSGSRSGSTVNNTAASKYALVQIVGVTHAGESTINGLLLFPDGKIITGKSLLGINNTTQTIGMNESELNNYLRQGCVFFPASGWWSGYLNDWVRAGEDGIYWSKTNINSAQASALDFSSNYVYTNSGGSYQTKAYYHNARLIR